MQYMTVTFLGYFFAAKPTKVPITGISTAMRTLDYFCHNSHHPFFDFRRLQQKWNTPAETCFYNIREYAAIATPQPAAPDEIGFVIYIERKFKNGFYFCTFRGILWVSGAGGYGAVIRQAAFFCNSCMSREAARNIRSQGSASCAPPLGASDILRS